MTDRASGRIGKITAYWTAVPECPTFRLVMERGRVTLGCWRFVGFEPAPDVETISLRGIFERIS